MANKRELEITRSQSKSYAFTVKKLGPRELNDLPEYWKWLAKVEQECIVSRKYYETDSDGNLHMHGIILVRKNFYLKKLCMKGYHVKFEELYDYDGWVKYITKDQLKGPEERGLSANVS